MDALQECSALAVDGSDADLDTVFRAQYPRVARIIFRIIRDAGRSEELAVEVFLRWSRARNASDGWLHRTAVRIALDELRRRTRRRRYEALSQLILRTRTPEELHAATEEFDAVRQVLASISRRDAELLLLRHQGLSYEEIAAAALVNVTSVGTLLRRAQVSFRKEYVKRYGDR